MRSEVKTPGLPPSPMPSGLPRALPISTTYAAPMVLSTPSLNANRSVILVGTANRKSDRAKPLFGTDVIGPESVYFIYACVVTLVVVCSSAYGRAPTQMHRSTEQHFIWYAAVDGRVTSEHKMKIDDSVQEDVLPGKCLIGGADETSVPKAKLCNTVIAKSGVSNTSPIAIPSKVVKKSGDSGCVEGSSVSATRGHNSSSEADSSSSDSDDSTGQRQTVSIVAQCEVSDDNQSPPSSLEESDPNMDHQQIVTQNSPPHVHWQTTGIPNSNPPKAPAKRKKRGTGKSGVGRQGASASAGPPRVLLVRDLSLRATTVPSSDSDGTWGEETDEGGGLSVASAMPSLLHSESDGTWGEETDEGGGLSVASAMSSLLHSESDGTWAEETDEGGGLSVASAMSSLLHSGSDGTWAEETDEGGGLSVASAMPSLLHSGSDGTWAEETDEDHHDFTSPHQSSQDEGDSTSTSTISVGEPPPEVLMHHNEQDVVMVAAWQDAFPGNGAGIAFVLQMFANDVQPPPPPEMWPLPVQESEEGRHEPSQLVA